MTTVDGQTILTICVSAFIFFSLGGVAGWLMSLLRAAPAKQASQAQPVVAETPAEPSPNQEPVEPDQVELARIYQERQDGRVFIKAGSRILNQPTDLREAERSWLASTAELIRTLLNRPKPAAPPEPSPVPSPPAIKWQPSPQPAAPKPSMNPADVLIRAVQAGQPKLDQSKSLVEQINDVLRELVVQSQHQGEDIHLVENIEMDLEVQVGSQHYQGIEAVPDESIRRLIRAAIAEWQRRFPRR